MMTSAEAFDLPELSSPSRSDAGLYLQATLTDLVDLSLLGKQIHWSVTGPLFRALYEQLDEMVQVWRELSDSVAERAVTIGFWPDGQADAICETDERVRVERGAVEDRAAIRLLTNRLARVAARCRFRMERLGDLDGASQDVVTEVVRALEEQVWMVRAQLPIGEARS
jgi:starvation-inducible DNA-binding protein